MLIQAEQFEDIIIPSINFNPLIKISLITAISIIIALYLNVPAFAVIINSMIDFIKAYYSLTAHSLFVCLTTLTNFIYVNAIDTLYFVFNASLYLGKSIAFLLNFNSVSSLTAAIVGGTIMVVLVSLSAVSLAFFISGLYSVIKNHFSSASPQADLPTDIELGNQTLQNMQSAGIQIIPACSQVLNRDGRHSRQSSNPQLDENGSPAAVSQSEASMISQSSIVSFNHGTLNTFIPHTQLRGRSASPSSTTSLSTPLSTSQALPFPDQANKREASL